MITARAVAKSYLGVEVLHDVDLHVPAGSFALLTGPSGSGKTTLLNLLAALDAPDGGSIRVDDTEVTALRGRQRARHRARHGHVFQRSGLLAGLTLRENIEAAHLLAGHPVDLEWVDHLAERLGVRALLDVTASRVSGGQGQRAALIRSLAHRPPLLFADEPTASLDTASKHTIHEVLREVVANEGTTVLMVSHDAISLDYATDVTRLVDGGVESDAEATGEAESSRREAP
ncbi:ABC transporter ATP-binding protein [Nocardioides sp.]|uniref:ABC transporter ATP-binding protein n=1 Tax=Nocardioides sp. TaxID=35761 RepID=UPI003514CF61